MHGSDSKAYDQSGELMIPQIINTLLHATKTRLLSKSSKNLITEDDYYLTFWEMLSMTQKNWDAFDYFGWWANKIEWFFVYALLAEKGRVKWDDIMGVYDGTIFYEIESKLQAK